MLKKSFIPKKKKKKRKKNVPENFDFLVSFVPSDISVWHEIQWDKKIGIMS